MKIAKKRSNSIENNSMELMRKSLAEQGIQEHKGHKENTKYTKKYIDDLNLKFLCRRKAGYFGKNMLKSILWGCESTSTFATDQVP